MERGALPKFEFQGRGRMNTLLFASEAQTFDNMLPSMLGFTRVDSTHAFGWQLPRIYGSTHRSVVKSHKTGRNGCNPRDHTAVGIPYSLCY